MIDTERPEPSWLVIMGPAEMEDRVFQRPFDQGKLGPPRAPAEEPAEHRIGHEPGIEVTSREGRDLADRFGPGRAGARPEVLDLPAESG